MTLLQAGTGDFVSLVSQYFLSLKGSGLVLSPREMALVLRWRDTGAPCDLVCRAIRDSMAAYRRARGCPEGPVPVSLLYCAPAVDEAIAAYRSRMVGRNSPAGPEPGEERRREDM